MKRHILQSFCGLLVVFSVAACANQHFRVAPEKPPPDATRYVELLREKQVANLHFPTGLYAFYAMDDKGFYYRSLRPIIQRTSGSSVRRKGGLFVSKQHSGKLRGYVYLAGAITHVGDLSRTPHQFRN